MTARRFVDTNVLIYAARIKDDDAGKSAVANSDLSE